MLPPTKLKVFIPLPTSVGRVFIKLMLILSVARCLLSIQLSCGYY